MSSRGAEPVGLGSSSRLVSGARGWPRPLRGQRDAMLLHGPRRVRGKPLGGALGMLADRGAMPAMQEPVVDNLVDKV